MQLIVFCKMPCYYKNQINEYNKPIHFVSFSVFLKINFDSTHFHGRFNVWTIDFKRLFSVYYSHTFGICSVFFSVSIFGAILCMNRVGNFVLFALEKWSLTYQMDFCRYSFYIEFVYHMSVFAKWNF